MFSDALNHASIIDGCRLAGRRDLRLRPRRRRAPGLGARAGRRAAAALIVTDGVFSMDGDVAPLAEIVELARDHDARVMVDEAHGTGALGPEGRGAVAAAGVEDEVDVIVGTLGKALGSYGAYVCCDRSMAKYLVNTVRTLHLLHGAPAAGRGGRRWPRSSCCASSRGGWRSSSATRRAARGARGRGAAPAARRHADPAAAHRRRRSRRGGQRARARAGGVRPGHPPARPCRTARPGCA